MKKAQSRLQRQSKYTNKTLKGIKTPLFRVSPSMTEYKDTTQEVADKILSEVETPEIERYEVKPQDNTPASQWDENGAIVVEVKLTEDNYEKCKKLAEQSCIDVSAYLNIRTNSFLRDIVL